MILNQLKIQAQQFINSSQKAQHLFVDHLTVYVRKTRRMINGELYQTFDIATISVEPAYQGNGLGSSAIDLLHGINPYQATFIESIINNRLYQHLKHKSWLDVERSVPPAVFKLKE